MNPPAWQSLGVGGIIVIFMIREVISFLKSKSNGEWKQEIHDLHVWHNKDDDEGVKVWYVRKSLETAITKLADSVDKQTAFLDRMASEVREVSRKVDNLPIVNPTVGKS